MICRRHYLQEEGLRHPLLPKVLIIRLNSSHYLQEDSHYLQEEDLRHPKSTFEMFFIVYSPI
jgi:hypothetical protein